MDQEQRDTARVRIRQVFEFLRAFNARKNRPAIAVRNYSPYVRWWHEFPRASAAVKVADLRDLADEATELEAADVLLRVCRPTLEPPPPPPSQVRPFVTSGWDDPFMEAEWQPEYQAAEDDLRTLDDVGLQVLEGWLKDRDGWAARARPDHEALHLFDWLWAIRALFDRESERYELVLGDGLLTWQTGEKRISHPLLLERVQLEFDPDLPAFTVVDTGQEPELAYGVLQEATADGSLIARLRDELVVAGCDPMSDQTADALFQRIATSLHTAGQFVGHADGEQIATAAPVISRDPVLFVRERVLGFEAAIEGVLADLETAEELPESLCALVGVFPAIGSDASVVDRFEHGDEVEDVLLTMEANREQLEIARRLERHAAVLVQGPPGTGKTHTIANLMGHLLAQGKSVLVTSQTTKALRVVREKVAVPLQPLCVSVLEGDAASNQQLQLAATEIASRLTSKSEDEYQRDAKRSREERTRILQEIRKTRARLFETVRGEYAALQVGGREWAPSEAAREVAQRAERDGWVAGPVPVDQPVPLTVGEIISLYATNAALTRDELRYLASALPDIATLMTPAEFRAGSEGEGQASLHSGLATELWRPASRDSTSLADLELRARAAAAFVDSCPDWLLEPLERGGAGDLERQPWERLQSALQECADSARAQRLASANGAELTGDIDPAETLAMLDDMIEHVRGGGDFGRFDLLVHRPWGGLLNRARVFDRRPKTVEDLAALRAIPAATLAWNEARQRWGRLLAEVEPPWLAARPDEDAVRRQAALIGRALSFATDLLQPLLRASADAGFDLQSLTAGRSWRAIAQQLSETLPLAVTAERWRLWYADWTRRRTDLLGSLGRFGGDADHGSPVADLTRAVQGGDPDAFERAHSALASLLARRDAAASRRALLDRLEPLAPGWAAAIRERIPPHDQNQPPGDPAKAWEFRQLCVALDAATVGVASPLITAISDLRGRLGQSTAELVESLTWANQAARTDPTVRAALARYVQTVRRIGKGTGRRTPEFRALARQEMANARSAVPVWIAPLSRVAEAFDPREQRFDVVIIDEASQLDVMGLLAWYLGRQVIVVGDEN